MLWSSSTAAAKWSAFSESPPSASAGQQAERRADAFAAGLEVVPGRPAEEGGLIARDQFLQDRADAPRVARQFDFDG